MSRSRITLSRLVWLSWLPFVLLLLAALSPARAQPAPASEAPAAPAAPSAPAAPPSAVAPFPAESWAGQLELLSRWLEPRRGAGRCTERCYTLDRLVLTGAVGEGALRFELSGGVLADGPIAVPLFGPPAHVRVEATLALPGAPRGGGAALAGEPAAIGFEKDHYYLWTAARRFVLRGTLSLEGDLTLVVPGPLNTLEADVTGGAVVEGSRLSGLVGATLHFSRDGGKGQSAGPTVFQLSRAVRVGREIGFEYRLVMRSGADLGVVRLPLAFGEKVLDVSGATGWRVEGGELVLPTSGRTAEMAITGSLAQATSFAPDARSGYEWWLFESDPEHRIIVKGDARQVDSAESPIPRTQATSRLFLVQRGQRIEVEVQPLSSVEVLAAVVRAHRRMLVLTERGDLVADDALTYENNGIDYLLYTPRGRPIYLATDDKAERIMHQGEATEEILVPLLTGSHSVRVQSLSQASLRPLVGSMELPVPRYPITASQMALTVGLPARVVPLALLGGDRPVWFADAGDGIAVALGFAAAWVAVRPGGAPSRARLRALRILGGLVLAGLWFLSPAAFVLTLLALAAAGVAWLLSRLLHGVRRVAALVALLGAVGFVGLVALVSVSGTRAPMASDRAYTPSSEAPSLSSGTRKIGGKGDDKTGNFLAQGAAGGVLEGVTPVALSLPTHARSLHVSRELVTRDRLFRPVLVYATDLALVPLLALWLVGMLVLAAAHRGPLSALYRRAVEQLAQAGARPDAEPPA